VSKCISGAACKERLIYLLKHYGIDWIAVILTIVGIYMLGNRQKWGFVVMIAGNVAWVAFGTVVSSIATIGANIVFVFMNARGFFRWTAAEKKTNAAAGES
jgi:drug/metabolite transporter (DMT)-like permease